MIIRVTWECKKCELVSQVGIDKIYFDVDIEEGSCPGCRPTNGDWQTCLCGGSRAELSAGLECPKCKYYGTMDILTG